MESKKKILIVDDVELNRAILAELFHENYEVLEASNGKEALSILNENTTSITIMLLDIIMPVMDGFEVLLEMKQNGLSGKIPVVMITAETSENIMQKGYDMGATDIISKPFAPNIIRQRINNIIEQYMYKAKLEVLVDQQTTALRNQSKKLRENSAQMIDILSTIIEFKNAESVEHIQNIRILTKLLLQRLATTHKEYRFSDEMIEIISEAAAMHDIGKVAIPDRIINKPGLLTPEEFEIMKTHTIKGCEILEKISKSNHLEYYDYGYEICRYHHERWDGNGYPDGLKGNQTPIWAQVVSLVDVYDALTSKRVYKDAYAMNTAIQMILAGECGVFNPVIIDCFQSIIPSLKNGEWKKPLKPRAINSEENTNDIIHRWSGEDISARTLHLLELERRKYRVLSELSEEILFDYDYDTDCVTFSEKFQMTTGKNPIMLHFKEQMEDSNFIYKEDKKGLFSSINKMTKLNPIGKCDCRINLTGEGFSWYEIYLYSLWDDGQDTDCVGFIGKLINIDEKKKENILLKEEAEKDPLTGVLNRKALKERVEEILSLKKIEQGYLCFIDIDDFKSVNDNHGHLFGDEVLKKVTMTLHECMRKEDLLGRIGGDEIVVFFKNIKDLNVLENRLDMIYKTLQKEHKGIRISLSIGISTFPKNGIDFEHLLECADIALYKAKLAGKNQYKIYKDNKEKLPFHSLQSKIDNM